MAYAVIISRGIKSLPMLKCSSERWVCAPQSFSAGTSTTPRLSVSCRVPDIAVSSFNARSHLVAIGRGRCKDRSVRLHMRLGDEVRPLGRIVRDKGGKFLRCVLRRQLVAGGVEPLAQGRVLADGP